MPFVLGIIGVVLLITGVRGTVVNTNPNLVDLVKADLTGTPNYIEWAFAILLIGSLGYIDALKGLSRAFMTLIIIVLIIDNKGFFAELVNSVKQISQNPPTPAQTNTTSQTQTPAVAQSGTNGLAQLPDLPSLDSSLFM